MNLQQNPKLPLQYCVYRLKSCCLSASIWSGFTHAPQFLAAYL